GSDSEYEVDPNRQKTHSFVNHYISDPTYYNSWRRQQKGISRAQAYSFTESESGDPEHHAPPPLPPLPPLPPQLSSPTPQPQQAQGQPQGQGNLFRPKGSRTPTPSQQSSNPPSQHSTLYRPPSSLAPGSRAPIAGFSSFV
ncbi:Protein sidekick-2, partial [Goodea atripinnis]